MKYNVEGSLNMRKRHNSISEAVNEDQSEKLQNKDVMKLADYPEMKNGLDDDEEIIYSLQLIKINKKKIRQKRVIM